MIQRKLRVIKSSTETQKEVYGITIPPSIHLFFPSTYFSVIKSGTSIILTSGQKIDLNTIEAVDLDLFKKEWIKS